MSERRARPARLAALAVLAASLAVVQQPAAAYPSSTVDLKGHGWGHGRGMGQWGALGYAVDHGWSSDRILQHFYGGTTAGDIGNPHIRVRLMKFDDRDTIVQQERGHLSTSAADGSFSALRAVRTGSNSFRVDAAGSCAGPWSTVAAGVSGPVVFKPFVHNDDRTEMLQACEPDGTNRWYRGEIHAVDGGGSARTVNLLDVQAYLRGVVPRESPASWAGLGGGAGMQELRAQAVAARSYGWSENRYSYAKTCDTDSCQVYKGRAEQTSSFRELEDARTDQAVADTNGSVRMLNGSVARTEFSASTGGYSAGGTFPAVVDDGDDIASNPHHDWTVSIGVSSVQSAYPSIGTLSAIRITKRNGLGDLGGRVQEIQLQGSNGTATDTGAGFRSKLGLKSDWFTVLQPGGYWIGADDGGIFSFGDAQFYGSMGGKPLVKPIVGMARTPSSKGYWMVASDGGIFSFGDAQFYGSMGGKPLVKPIVGMARTGSGNGYWMVASDGGIFSFGDAQFYGSMGGKPLVKPIVGMGATKTGGGYYLVAADGGVFTFGDAVFYGSVPGVAPSSKTTKIGIAVTNLS